jgi:putative methyltransferase (TIGR04325 family)
VTWSGNYANWADAYARSTGYDSPAILEQCKSSLLKVQAGEAAYERDGVLFEKKQYSFGLLTALLRVALENDGNLSVLDFGGSLGSSYFQNRDFLAPVKDLKWSIVEQANFVSCGISTFESDQLKFYPTLDSCLRNQQPNLLLLSGVLQCLDDPFAWVQKFMSLKLPYIVIDRTAFAESEQHILTVERVPPAIYPASYPSWFFNEKKFLEYFHMYESVATFDSFCDGPILLNGAHKAYWGGHILKLRS